MPTSSDISVISSPGDSSVLTDATVNYASEPVKGTKYTVEADAPRPPTRNDSKETEEGLDDPDPA
jgi:hypothetical protein